MDWYQRQIERCIEERKHASAEDIPRWSQAISVYKHLKLCPKRHAMFDTDGTHREQCVDYRLK